MNVLHYSLSLSACPKCHLLICKHTSLANLNFNSIQQRQSNIECSNTTISNLKNSYQQSLSHNPKLYIYPSTISNNHHRWTTISKDSIENIPFTNETLINSSLLLTPTLNRIVRTQSEKFYHHFPKKFLTKSFSFSTLYNNKSTTYSHKNYLLIKSFSYTRILFLIFLLLSFLITNTIDIILIYIYYYTNYISLISIISTIILCELILWINNLIQLNTTSSYLLLIPFTIRFYLLYKFVELLTIIFDKNPNTQILNSSLYKIKQEKLYYYLNLFYLIHTGFLTFINLYILSNNFQFPIKSLLNINYFFPKWIFNIETTYSSSISIFILISILYYLIINYSFILTYVIHKKFSFIIILSRLCLIFTRIYTFIFLFYLNISWLLIIFFLGHFILMIILLFDRLKYQHKQYTMFIQIIFSLITYHSINDISINIIILLENLFIFFHRFYIEIFSFNSNETTIYLIIFLSILILLQIIGFILNILSKKK